MPRQSRPAWGVLAALAVLGLGLFTDPTPARPAADADWKTVLTDADLTKLVEETAKTLQAATKSASEMTRQKKVAERQAQLLLLCSQAGVGAEGDLAKKCGALQATTQALLEALRKGDQKEANKQAAALAKFKTAKGENAAEKIDVVKEFPIDPLMKEVEETNKLLQGYKRMATKFNSGSADAALASQKMAALTMAITAHVPEKDEGKKTKKVWIDSTSDTREATLAMTAAAKAKKYAEFKEAFAKMESACAKCHEFFREGDK